MLATFVHRWLSHGLFDSPARIYVRPWTLILRRPQGKGTSNVLQEVAAWP